MNSGSFFLCEMSRMMSSFRPGGAASASTSVTKPYLYSCLTKPSMVSVAVLIVESLNRGALLNCSLGLASFPGLGRALRTQAADRDLVTAWLEAPRHRHHR